MAREVGPRAIIAFRHARVGLWRFKRSPAQQDRAAMYATFAFIGFFAVGSVDAIITGGADFAPHSAYAAEYRPTSFTPPAPVAQPIAAEAPVIEETLKAVEVDYSFTTETLLGGPDVQVAVAQDPTPEGVAAEGGKVDVTKPNTSAPLDEPAL